MLIWIPLTIFGLVIAGWLLSRQTSNLIPVFVNGLIPSLPGAMEKSESGTTVYVRCVRKADVQICFKVEKL